MKKIGLISLGCDKNRVDSELLLGSAVANNYEIVVDPMQADFLIVNTCAFIESARKEAIEAIFDLVNVKNATGAKLIVTGCMAQRYPEQLYDEIPEIDAIIGADHYSDFADVLNKLLDNTDSERILDVSKELTKLEHGPRVLTTPKHYAYLKIADGCNNFCTYCSIPYIRGRYRSVKLENIIAEASILSKNGAKELILVAQDVTDYGTDIYEKRMLTKLIDELSKIETVDTIRLLYCYPEHVDDELIKCIANNQKVAKYIDLPLQHVNDNVLKRMNRKITKQEIIEVIKKLRQNVYGISIRSTFICGFPGETDEDAEELAQFLSEEKLTNVGFFEYCQEEGTPAFNYPNQIDSETKRKRLSMLASTQFKVAHARNLTLVGGRMRVVVDAFNMVDSNNKFNYVCRTREMAPNIDGVVFVSSDNRLSIGEKIRIKVTNCSGYDLIGEIDK